MKEQIDALIQNTQERIDELKKLKAQTLANHHASDGAIAELGVFLEKLKALK